MSLSKNFISKKLVKLNAVNPVWNLGRGNHYVLNLRMCHLQNLSYSFAWGSSISSDTADSVIDTPSAVVKLDLSLNDLTMLEHNGLAPFVQLRALDASLNRLVKFNGVEVLKDLYEMNLSHNCIKQVEGLHTCHSLVQLNLAMNEIEHISYMPTLSSLRVLHLSNNMLTDLDGIQALAHLKELHVQHNKLKSIVPLSSSRQLSYLDASDNKISALPSTVATLKSLPRLKVLNLQGNPIEKDNNYRSQLADAAPGLMNFDNSSIRKNKDTNLHPQTTSMPKLSNDRYRGEDAISVKHAISMAIKEQIHAKRQTMEENVSYLQNRVLSLQDEYREYEDKMLLDLDACLAYLDTLPLDMLQLQDPDSLREHIGPGSTTKPWHHAHAPRHKRNNVPDDVDDDDDLPIAARNGKADYTGITNTDEVLRHAYNELAKTSKNLNIQD